MNDSKLCPFCAEEVKPDARKCKHCGEWLDDSQPLRTSAPVQLPHRVNEPSEMARAVSKGVKEQRSSEFTFTAGTIGLAVVCVGMVVLFPSLITLLVGFFGFILGFLQLRKGYYKE